MFRRWGGVLVLCLAVAVDVAATPPDVVGPVFELRTPATNSYLGVATAADSGVIGTAIGDLYLRAFQKLLISTNDGLTAALTIDGSGNLVATGSISAASFNGNATSAATFTGSLSGDVTGTQNSTVVASVGGQSAAAVASATVAANQATAVVSSATIVKREPNGWINASAIHFTADDSVQISAGPRRTNQQIATLRWYDVNYSFPQLAVGTGPIGITFDGENIWTVNNSANSVTKISASAGRVINTYPVGTSPFAAASDGTYLWVTNYITNDVTKLKVSDGSVAGTYNVGSNPRGIAFDGKYIWTANFGSANVSRLLATDGSDAGTFATGSGTTPYGIAVDNQGNVWVTNSAGNTVVKLKGSDGSFLGTLPTAPVSNAAPRHVVFDGIFVWVSNFNTNTIRKIYGPTGSFADITLPVNNPEGMVFDGTNVWVACYVSNVLLKLKGSDGTVIASVPLSNFQQRYLAFDGKTVWAANFALDSVSRY